MNTLINTKSGEVKIGKVLIYKRMIFEEAIHLAKEYKHEIVDLKNGYKWLNLQEVVIKNTTFYFGFCFNNEKLEFIDFGFWTTEELSKPSIVWSIENQRSKQKIYKKWLQENVGKKSKFNWGEIEYYHSTRSASTGILIKYNP